MYPFKPVVNDSLAQYVLIYGTNYVQWLISFNNKCTYMLTCSSSPWLTVIVDSLISQLGVFFVNLEFGTHLYILGQPIQASCPFPPTEKL